MARYLIDPERSTVWIDATSSVHPIHSESTGLEGWFEEPSGHLELAVDRLKSGNPLLDREMKRRIDARHYPKISGDLTGMEAEADGRYKARGEITFRGVTRAVDGELTVTMSDDDTVRITGERVFDIRDFDFEPPRILMLRVHPEVSVRIDVVATKGRP